ARQQKELRAGSILRADEEDPARPPLRAAVLLCEGIGPAVGVGVVLDPRPHVQEPAGQGFWLEHDATTAQERCDGKGCRLECRAAGHGSTSSRAGDAGIVDNEYTPCRRSAGLFFLVLRSGAVYFRRCDCAKARSAQRLVPSRGQILS